MKTAAPCAFVVVAEFLGERVTSAVTHSPVRSSLSAAARKYKRFHAHIMRGPYLGRASSSQHPATAFDDHHDDSEVGFGG